MHAIALDLPAAIVGSPLSIVMMRGDSRIVITHRTSTHSCLWSGFMKIGILISTCLVAIIIVGMTLAMRGSIDRRTDYSAPKMLEVRSFSGLPALVEINQGDASAVYDEMITFYNDYRATLDTIDSVEAEQAEKCIDLLIKAQEAGTITSKYIDSKIPLVPNAAPEFAGAFQVIADVAMHRAEELRQRNQEQKDRAMKAAKAAFALGQTLFEKSNRVPIRTAGIAIMTSGGTPLFNWSGEGNELAQNVTKWTEAINDLIENYWKGKSEVVYSLRLNTPDLRATVGDLLAYATEDKDVSWRVEATLALGRAKYMVGAGKGNNRGILSTIAKLKDDPEKLVADAAKAADAYTREDVKKMN